MEKAFRVPRQRPARFVRELFIPRPAAGREVGFTFRLIWRLALLRWDAGGYRVAPGMARLCGGNARRVIA